jgi:hypothetical protein
LIYQKYGDSLWQPSYNYAKVADSINASLLAEHPLVWSHPEEVGSFKMWYNYEQKSGLQNVFKNRWQYTSRDKYAIYIQENNPTLVNDFINTKIGKESFALVSDIPSRKFEELYNPEGWKILFRLINKSDQEINKYTGLMKTKKIDINVPGPQKKSPVIEIILIISSLLLFMAGKLIFKPGSR